VSSIHGRGSYPVPAIPDRIWKCGGRRSGDVSELGLGLHARFAAAVRHLYFDLLPGNGLLRIMHFPVYADKHRALALAALGVICACLPLPSSALADPLPVITEKMIMDAILQDLAYNAPNVVVDLDRDASSHSVANLARAGIVRVFGATVYLTKRGQRIAAARGWFVGLGEIKITVGRLVYVPGSATLGVTDGIPNTASYRWRYEANTNLSYLLQIGPASSWASSIYPNCLSPQNGSGVNTRTILIARDGHDGWGLMEAEPIRDCAQ